MPSYSDYVTTMQRIADIRAASAVLQWDQETYLPPKGAHFRGRQLSTLSEIAHEEFCSDSIGALLDGLLAAGTLDDAQRRNVELSLEDYQKARKYSASLVRRLSDAGNNAFHSWMEARRRNDFRLFAPALTEMVALKKEEASVLGYTAHPYDALLNEYEKGATTAQLDAVFGALLPQLRGLLDELLAQPAADDSFLRQHYPADTQWQWGLHLLRALGFDGEAGRQDRSEHPFSTSFSPQDVRITTRIDEADFANMTWSTIHELGHALYEQGLPPEQYGLPLGEAASLSIHESQSRLWENNVGRSPAFWEYWLPQLRTYFPGQLAAVDGERFFRGINKVQPSLIRTEADEVTYHFHVYIRYTLEKALLDGSLQVADVPGYWKENYRKWLGVTPPDDKSGALQDVHWSHGSFGYFPTYSLGSLYAAQFYAAAAAALPGLEDDLRQGRTERLLDWLRREVHQHGRRYTSDGLCRRITAQSLSSAYFIDYVRQKYGLT
ncbi:carboxypeptidase M32 [Flaviaesturariibacter aridisoli]|uniref:Metal-dependent carboxypeptidase n=1 Tax=Flaviaesturariibacter aridisoli TaxID=2545761 RepID=A0A4V2WMF6_9BACT|nr:carboxypeptidase M32 [Flaviaesturariibacter aridisoli]TCZ68647.1 carboxypeptidase M32 [Flaviaesturariibacter aridisoli]